MLSCLILTKKSFLVQYSKTIANIILIIAKDLSLDKKHLKKVVTITILYSLYNNNTYKYYSYFIKALELEL